MILKIIKKLNQKSSQDYPKIIPKSFQNHPKIIPKWAENHPKIITNVSHIHPKVIPKSTQNQFKHSTKSTQIDKKSPNILHRSQLIMSRSRHLNDLGWWGFRVTQRARWRGCRRPLDIYIYILSLIHIWRCRRRLRCRSRWSPYH